MALSDLVRMANQIADFYRAYGEVEAQHGIASHIDSFWERRMRDELVQAIERGDASGLKPIVIAALTRPQPTFAGG
jgi:formate dehydrogenase subunit delta